MGKWPQKKLKQLAWAAASANLNASSGGVLRSSSLKNIPLAVSPEPSGLTTLS